MFAWYKLLNSKTLERNTDFLHNFALIKLSYVFENGYHEGNLSQFYKDICIYMVMAKCSSALQYFNNIIKTLRLQKVMHVPTMFGIFSYDYSTCI